MNRFTWIDPSIFFVSTYRKMSITLDTFKSTLLCLFLFHVQSVEAQSGWTNATYAFYIGLPIIVVLLYAILITFTWPMARRRSFFPFWLLLLIFIFPPAFLFWWLWIFILATPYYFYPRSVIVREGDIEASVE